MDERECLVKAQQAEALANSSKSVVAQLAWENMAKEYRRLALMVIELKKQSQADSQIKVP